MSSGHKFRVAVVGLILAAGSVAGAAQSAENSDFDVSGSWLGTLRTSGVELRLLFKIGKNSDGALRAVLVSLDQGGVELPVDQVSVRDRVVSLTIARIGGGFEGTYDPAGDAIDGVWKQSGATLPLRLERSEAPVARRPQDPVEPVPYLSEEVSFSAGKDGEIKIAGTLTIPRTEGPHPAAVLISGSGPQDRDEAVFGHRPFLVLADHLTRHGIAVLRADDRGIGGSTGSVADATSEDLAGDVRAALRLLKSRNAIDPARIGLIGHSEGGIIAPLVAADSPDVAFVVLMAAPGLPGKEILYRQGDLLAKAQGVDEATRASQRALQEAIFEAVEGGGEATELRQRVRTAIEKWLAESDESARKLIPDPEAVIRSQSSLVASRWFRFFLTYDPRPALQGLQCPVLAVTGEKDLQVPPAENLAAIREALAKGGNQRFTIQTMEGLNHLFQHADTGALSEYAKIEETMAPEVLRLIAEWIAKQVR